MMIFRFIFLVPRFWALHGYPGDKKRRPIGVALVTPRRAGALEFHLGLRSGAHQLTSVLQRRTDYFVPSGGKGGYYPDP